jgi:hypothetical protein
MGMILPYYMYLTRITHAAITSEYPAETQRTGNKGNARKATPINFEVWNGSDTHTCAVLIRKREMSTRVHVHRYKIGKSTP